MKFILSLLVLITTFSNAQMIEESQIDEFTGAMVLKTSTETVVANMKKTVFFTCRKVDSTVMLQVKMMMNQIFSVKEGGMFMLKLVNGEVVTLYNPEFTITCRGCGARGFSGSGAEGISLTFYLNNEQVDKLKKNQVSKIRLYTSEGYIEDEIKEKYAPVLPYLLKLIE